MRTKLGIFRKMIREHFETELESVNRAKRGEEDDYKDEYEGVGVTYETNLYSDSTSKVDNNDNDVEKKVVVVDDEDDKENPKFESFKLPPLKQVLETTLAMEVTPSGDSAESFIQKNKEDFKKRYGDRWEEVLYATAWKMFGKK